jgi:hypothetical protein
VCHLYETLRVGGACALRLRQSSQLYLTRLGFDYATRWVLIRWRSLRFAESICFVHRLSATERIEVLSQTIRILRREANELMKQNLPFESDESLNKLWAFGE